MDEVAPVSPRRRKARCPTCRGFLEEPGSPIYECPFCFTLLVAKGTPPDFLAELVRKPTTDNDQVLQGSQQTHGLEAISTGGNIPTRQQSQEQVIDPCETDASGDGNIKLPEQSLVPVENGSVKNTPKSELQLEVDAGRDGSAAIGNRDMLADWASNTCTATADEGMAAGVPRLLIGGGKEDVSASSGGEESTEEHLLSDNMNEQCTLSSGDDKLTSQLPLEDAEKRCEPNGREEERELVGDCESMEGKDHKDCHPEEGEGAKHIFQSEIIRDNDCDLSFKYICSARESTNQFPSRNRRSRPSKLSSETLGRVSNMLNHLTDKLPSSSNESSEDLESCPSASESIDSHDSTGSEFDFPSPSADSMKPAKISDLLIQQQVSSPNVSSDVLAAPHQLEWEDAGLENEEIPRQKSISATVVSTGAVIGDVSSVLIGIERGDPVESADGDWHHQKTSSPNGTLSVGLEDTAAVPITFLQALREDGVPGIGGLADLVGLVDLKGEKGEETKGDSDGGYLGSHSYQVNGHESDLYTDLGEEVPRSILAGAEHPSKQGANTSSTLVLGTEAACMWSVSDGCNVENCRASPEMTKLTNSVTNIQQVGDSITTIARKNTVIIGGSDHSEIASQMMLTKKISERASDTLHHQQNQFLQAADNHRRAASTIDFTNQRDAEKGYLAQKNEAEYAGMPSVSKHSNPSNRSMIDNFDARLPLQRNDSSETTRGRNRDGTVANMFDSRLRHKRDYSFEETQVQSEGFTRYTSQVPPKNVHYEGHHVSRSTRGSDGSSNTHYTHGQAALMHADGQWSWSQKPNVTEHNVNYPSPSLTDVCGFPPASLQPFGYTYYSNGSDSFARGASFQYQQVPSHSCPFPVAMPGQAFIYCGCHSVAPVCMACIHDHHSDLPQLSMPPHGFCCNQAFPIAHQHGLCNSHQAHQIQPFDQGASVAHYPSVCLPSRAAHMHDSVMAMEKQQVSSARKSTLYPPIPRGNAAPYVICNGCEEILNVPTDMPFSDRATQKLRCGSCGKVAKFSPLNGNHGAGNNVALQSRTTVASAKTSHLVQHPEAHSRPLPVSKVVQTREPSYYQDLYPGVVPPYKQGSFDSQRQISAAINTKSRASSIDETGATTDHDSQDEFFFKSLSRQYCEFDSSRMFFNGFKAASSTLGASNYRGEVSIVGDGISMQAPVDEKDEGLDFGAPRMSDGESLDQRSPDSRMRSPEHMQHIQSRDQNRRMQNSCGDHEASRKNENVMLELKKRSIAQGKRPTPTLLTLLSQESSKFETNKEERISFDECRSALCSTSSSSPVHDHLTNEKPGAGGKSRPQFSKLTSTGFVRKGPSSVANMLRRSIKHFHRVSQ